ncbi:hypothetical protein [Rhodanobacter geophilus]|uniref:Uncharacterized protein n=1 Tax=Rhodanobacter geophilus TaxID=3162488 RepID=A0ABV3QSJ0_9GAMM
MLAHHGCRVATAQGVAVMTAMQLGTGTIDTIEDGGNAKVATDLTRDKWMSGAGAGVAGPAVIAGALLLLNKIALQSPHHHSDVQQGIEG